MKQKIWRLVRPLVRPVGAVAVEAIFYILRVFPIKKNKVVACVSGGRRYDDNQRFIMEEFHKLRPDADIVWGVTPDETNADFIEVIIFSLGLEK